MQNPAAPPMLKYAGGNYDTKISEHYRKKHAPDPPGIPPIGQFMIVLALVTIGSGVMTKDPRIMGLVMIVFGLAYGITSVLRSLYNKFIQLREPRD